MALAELVLAGDYFEQRVGDLSISGFVFDMWKVHEDFVYVALREAMRAYGGGPLSSVNSTSTRPTEWR